MFESITDPHLLDTIRYLKVLEKTFNSNTICSAKWLQATTLLYNGTTHSCHHNPRHKIDYYDVQKNHTLIFNTPQKIKERKMMKSSNRPSGCEYCWKFEDQGDLSDRYYKSASYLWSRDNIDRLETNTPLPTYFEIAFDNTCNFKCMYCTPESSSKWMEEIKRHGPYETSDRFNCLDQLIKDDKVPIANKDYNPYIEAFWKWWVQLRESLTVLRLTGGEPLLSKHVWKIIDELIDKPNQNMILGINTNLGVEDNLIDRFIEKIKVLEKTIKRLEIYTSCEAYGEQAEYIRFGLNYNSFLSNCDKILANTKDVHLIIMMANNVLSIFSLKEFIKDIQKLQIKYPNRIILDMAVLTYPAFLAINILEESITRPILEDVICHLENTGTARDVESAKRLLNSAYRPVVHKQVLLRDFAKFFIEYDKRRKSDFNSLFPQLNYLLKEYQKNKNNRPIIRAKIR